MISSSVLLHGSVLLQRKSVFACVGDMHQSHDVISRLGSAALHDRNEVYAAVLLVCRRKPAVACCKGRVSMPRYGYIMLLTAQCVFQRRRRLRGENSANTLNDMPETSMLRYNFDGRCAHSSVIGGRRRTSCGCRDD